MRAQTLVEAVKEAGVVGAGGAGFPTHVKYASRAEILIINGAECEPLLRVDQQLLERYAQEIVVAALEVQKALGADRLIFALKGKYKGASLALSALRPSYRFEVFEIEDFYPAGDETILVYDATGRLVPAGGIPIEVGVVVSNVETVLNVGNALRGAPVVEKYLTLAGEVAKPVTLKVPVGVQFQDILAGRIEGRPEDYFLIAGGPMMSTVVTPGDVVTKTTKGLIVLPKDHPINVNREGLSEKAIFKRSPQCDLCRNCTDLCPYYLMGSYIQPHRIMQTVGNSVEFYEDALAHAFLCRECGVCEVYACPVRLPVRQVIKLVKRELEKRGKKNPYHVTDMKTSPWRDFRRVPTNKLISRLGIAKYDLPAPLVDEEVSFARVALPLKQHVGAPSEPLVKKGDVVQKGQLIARIPEKAIGSNIHASVSGIVEEVSDKIVIRRS